MIPIVYNLRSLTVRKTTTVAAGLGLGLVVFVFASVMMLSNGVEQATRRAADPSGAIVLRRGATTEIESELDEAGVDVVAASPGVARSASGHPLAVGELIVLVILDKLGGGLSNVQLRGVPDGMSRFRPSVKIVEGRAARPGTDEAVVGKAIRGRYRGLAIGETLELRKNRPMRVVGFFADDGSSYESEIWADANVVRATFGKQGIVSSVRVQLTSPAAFDAFRTAIETGRTLRASAWRESEFGERQTRGTATFLSALGFAIALLLSLGATAGAMVTMHATISNRRREIGTLRALGFSRAQILASFLLESLAVSLAGGVGGATASLLMSLERISMMNVTTWSELSFRFEPTPGILVVAMAIAGAMGLVGGLAPALRATWR